MSMSVSALFDLSTRVAIVTGASSGIGRTIALALADAGAAVVLVARREAELEQARHEIEGAGGRAVSLPALRPCRSSCAASLRSTSERVFRRARYPRLGGRHQRSQADARRDGAGLGCDPETQSRCAILSRAESRSGDDRPQLGAHRFNLLTIGLTNDESAGNALVATAAKADGFIKNPQSIKAQTIVLTANSTGDYAVQSCLAKWGLKKADVTIKSMGQAEIISAMSSNNADLGGLWAPNIYTMEEKAGAKVICSGKETGTVIPGALVVRADYAKEHPQDVAKFLAVYLRAWKWMNAHRSEAIAMMKKFYELGGVTISEASMRKEFDTRPTFDLAGHLKIMDRATGTSDVDKWLTQIGEFMKSSGSIAEAPATSAYITDEYMRMVDRDPKLKAFANSIN